MFENADKVVPIIFAGTWIVLVILSFYLFNIRNDYKFKVKYFKYFTIMLGIMFIGYAAAMGAPRQVYFMIVPAVGLMTFMSLKFTRFCRNCGKTIINHMPFTSIEFCPKCGSRLKDQT